MSFFFFLLSPTVPFTLGRLGIPIFGNKAIPSWLWHSPRNNFLPVSFSDRKRCTSLWIALHWHRARSIDRRQNLAACCFRSCCLFLIPLHHLLNVLYTYFIFSAILTFAAVLLRLALTVPYFMCVSNNPLLFNQFSRGCANDLFSSSVCRLFASSEETAAAEQVYNLLEEWRISLRGFVCLFPIAVLFESVLGFRYDSLLHEATLAFVGNLVLCDDTLYSQMFHECIWP